MAYEGVAFRNHGCDVQGEILPLIVFIIFLAIVQLSEVVIVS